MKKCTKCGIEKELSLFPTDKRKKDNRSSWCRKCTSNLSLENLKKRAEKEPDYYRWVWIKQKYGITQEQYNEMYTNQNGCCAICGEHQDSFTKNLAVDHCHSTEKVRGLLCINCNTALGSFKDNISFLLKAVEYLTNPPYKDKD